MNEPDEQMGILHQLIPRPSPDRVRAVLAGGTEYESFVSWWQEVFAGQRQWQVKMGPSDQDEVVNIRVIEDRVVVWVREGHPADQELMDGLNESLRRRFYDDDAPGRTAGPWISLDRS